MTIFQCCNFFNRWETWDIVMHESKIHTSLGVSMVKWRTLDPCLVVGESDSKIYNTLDFLKKIIIDI